MTGRFISLEGGEGVGKSTQLARLADALRARGVEVRTTREPGGSAGAEAIRTLVMQGGVDRWSPQAEALLFAAARADHVERVIRPALAAGCWVMCDRFLDSSRAYQGVQGVDDAVLLALHGFGSAGLLPDRTLLMELAGEDGADRARRRDGEAEDRYGARDSGFHRAVGAAFDGMAAAEPARFRRVAADGPPDAVTARLLEAIADLLP